MTDPAGPALPFTLPVPASVPRACVDRALAELGLGSPEARDAIVQVAIGPRAVELEVIAMTSGDRLIHSVTGALATHRVVLAIDEG